MGTVLSKRVLGGCVLLFCATCALGDDWPQWRGPNRDNKVNGFTEPKAWPKELTKKWKVTVGEGLASPSLVGDKLFVFTGQGGNEVIRCLDSATGKEVWKESYATRPVSGIAGSAGNGASIGPRGAPAVSDGKVCTFGVNGVLSCLEADTGKVLWRKDTGAKPKFYTASSPLITDSQCIIHTGALTGYDLATGAEKWKWSGDSQSYGSPVAATIGGVKQIVTLTDRNLVGVNLADGKLLWKTPFNQGRYQTATPIIDGSTVILSGTAYTIDKKGDEFTVTQLWKDQAPHQYTTPVLKDGLLYGYSSRRNLYCQDAKTGKVLWNDNVTRGECGYILDIGNFLVALSSDSKLVVFKPSKEGYMEVASYKVSDSATWSEPVLSGNRIFVKDKEALTLWTVE